MSSSEELFSDGVGSSDVARDTCSCKGRAHKRDYPFNPRKKAAMHKKQYAKRACLLQFV